LSAIWHDHGLPSFLGTAPRFSFFDVAEIVQPAPAVYEARRERMQRWERKMGAGWFQHNAELAKVFWQMKRPWWL
jgi:hypothetical protein